MEKYCSAFVLLVALAGCIEQVGPGQTTGSPPTVGPGVWDFQWSPEEPRVGQSVQFAILNGDKGVDVEEMAWWVDTQFAGKGASLRFVFLEPGPHQVSLTLGRTREVNHIVAILPAHDDQLGTAGVPEGSNPSPWIQANVGPFGAELAIVNGNLEIVEIAWDFGDGNISKELRPMHFYSSPGKYPVRATLITSDGAVITIETTLEVKTQSPGFELHLVGYEGGEPTVGVTSSGCIFFQASDVVARSCDEGKTWAEMNGALNSPNSRDPYLWVDPATDRVFSTHLEPNGECIWIAWSDNEGESWLGNPVDCGPVPFADHQKLVTGPRVGPLSFVGSALYEQAVYLCFNRFIVSVGLGAGISCHVSLDGGATFPVMSQVKTGTGLHGSIQVGSDGALLLPARTSPITVYSSQDGALTWTAREVGIGAGVQSPTKDPEIAVDESGAAFLAWVGADDLLRIARSPDGGESWEPEAIVSQEITSVAFPAIEAQGGLVATAFLGSADFRGNPQDAPSDAKWNLYVAWALDAPQSSYFVQRVTTDPVQIGPICMTSCEDGSRNLLDFIDVAIDDEGRLYVAFADGCVEACVTNPAAENSRTAAGVLARQSLGPFLASAHPPRP